jgi:hypothetical protein
MHSLTERKSRNLNSALLIVAVLMLAIFGTDAKESPKTQTLTTPQGVRLLMNKSFDDSQEARKEILSLYKDLRVTDVLDGMDLIVADGDGVIVVARQHALEVAKLAREINLGDEKSRAERFKRLAIPLDETVKVK